MFNERNLWIGATTVAIGILLLLMVQQRSRAAELLDVRVHSIAVDPDDRQRLYLGTDLGMMVSIDGGRTWMSEVPRFGPAAVTMRLSLNRAAAAQKQ